jgi:hypothetical protein
MQAANSIWRRQIKLTLLLAWAGCWRVQAANLLSYWHVQVVGVFEGSATPIEGC